MAQTRVRSSAAARRGNGVDMSKPSAGSRAREGRVRIKGTDPPQRVQGPVSTVPAFEGVSTTAAAVGDREAELAAEDFAGLPAVVLGGRDVSRLAPVEDRERDAVPAGVHQPVLGHAGGVV